MSFSQGKINVVIWSENQIDLLLNQLVDFADSKGIVETWQDLIVLQLKALQTLHDWLDMAQNFVLTVVVICSHGSLECFSNELDDQSLNYIKCLWYFFDEM